MPNYRRNFVARGCYFLALTLGKRQRTLLTDHLHCIRTLPPDTDDFSVRWRLIKLLFSKGLPSTDRFSATRRR